MNGPLSPLADALFKEQHLLLASHDVDEVVDGCTRALRPHRLSIRGRSPELATRLFHLPMGAISINRLQYGCDVSVDPAVPEEDNFLITLPVSGSARFSYGDTITEVVPGRGAIVSPYRNFRFEIDSAFDQIILRLDRRRVETMCAALLDADKLQPVHFDLTLKEIPTFWLRLLESVAHLSEHQVSRNSRISAHIEDLVIETLILCQPHQLASDLSRGARTTTPPNIRRAIDYMRAHIADQLRLDEVARQCGLSLRSLQMGFQRHIGMSPGAWLRSERLDRVRAALRAAEPGTVTVTELALEWGFFHMGEFAAQYRKRFGKTPSSDLGNS